MTNSENIDKLEEGRTTVSRIVICNDCKGVGKHEKYTQGKDGGLHVWDCVTCNSKGRLLESVTTVHTRIPNENAERNLWMAKKVYKDMDWYIHSLATVGRYPRDEHTQDVTKLRTFSLEENASDREDAMIWLGVSNNNKGKWFCYDFQNSASLRYTGDDVFYGESKESLFAAIDYVRETENG